jgi:hypothetical protein
MYMAFCDMNLYVRVVRSTPDPLMTNKILYIYICQSLGDQGRSNSFDFFS